MYVYLQAYEQGAASVQPLVAFVSFYRAQPKCSKHNQRKWPTYGITA
jgi:hypothetical protein